MTSMVVSMPQFLLTSMATSHYLWATHGLARASTRSRPSQRPLTDPFDEAWRKLAPKNPRHRSLFNGFILPSPWEGLVVGFPYPTMSNLSLHITTMKPLSNYLFISILILSCFMPRHSYAMSMTSPKTLPSTAPCSSSPTVRADRCLLMPSQHAPTTSTRVVDTYHTHQSSQINHFQLTQ